MPLLKVNTLITLFSLFLTSLVIAAPSYDLTNGKKIYDTSCFTCHAAGVADAPKSHDVGAWKERFHAAATAEKTHAQSATAMDYLVKQVQKGRLAMPPKGMCNDCSRDDFADAIHYMATEQK